MNGFDCNHLACVTKRSWAVVSGKATITVMLQGQWGLSFDSPTGADPGGVVSRGVHTPLLKGLSKLDNIVAETLFPVMFPRWLNEETYIADATFVSLKQKCF